VGHPDNKFADAVLASVATGDAPNFDMPDELPTAGMTSQPIPLVAGQGVSTAHSTAPDDQPQA